MNRLLASALLFASLAARAEDRRIEAVRADDAPPIVADNSPPRPEAIPPAADQTRAPVPYTDRKDEASHSFVRVGGMLGLVSLPRPVDGELFVRVADLVQVGFGYSDFPAFVSDPLLSAAGLKNGSTTVRIDDFSAIDFDLRVFPFMGNFFVGTSFGHQSVKGAVTESTFAGPQTGVVEVSTIYATPRVGWQWTFGPGILLGVDAGVQLKLGADRNVTLPPGASADMQKDANNLVDLASSYPLPSFHLRFGWSL